MGIVSRVISFLSRETKVDRGAGDNVTARHFADPGDDSHPLPGDWCALSGAAGSGRQSAVGYYDAKNASKATAGEKRIYSRNAEGALAAEVWLKNDKTVIISNGAGLFTMEPGGDVVINGARITKEGEVIAANGAKLGVHVHTQPNDSRGDSQPDTNGPKL